MGQIGDEKAMAILGLLAVAAPWFSFSSVFVDCRMRGCARDRPGRAQDMEGAGLAAGNRRRLGTQHRSGVSRLELAAEPGTTMYVFWNFAFLPVPPASRADLVKLGGILLEVFVNPLNLVAPVLPALGVVLPLVLLLLGGPRWPAATRTSS